MNHLKKLCWWVQNTHLFSSAWGWQHNVLMTCRCCKWIISLCTRHTQICYFTCKLGSSLPVWPNCFCSFELKLLHSYRISFPYLSLPKKKETKWALQAILIYMYSHVLVNNYKQAAKHLFILYTYICPSYVKVCIKVARQFFRVNTSQVWALTTSP